MTAGRRVATLAVLLALCAGKGDDTMAATVRAPEFPAGLAWLNTAQPLTLAALRGKVVLLDFWTFCCINCQHILPELRELEHRYADSVVVIGVHSAKFTNEGVTASIREAVLRYGVEHPVVNDAAMKIWDSYAVRAWPTLVVISPDGRVVDQRSGEFRAADLWPTIDGLLQTAGEQGTLRRGPAAFRLERQQQAPTLLSFPGKVAVDLAAQRLCVADSSHHRYLLAGLDGRVTAVIGSGERGFRDGPFATAQFDQPQGLALAGDRLYLCDTGNHALRVADLAAGTVSTLIGNGRQALGFNRVVRGTDGSLNSPWDVVEQAGRLFVANAGSHQIWVVDPGLRTAEPYAGSGRENLVDGARFVPDTGPWGVDVRQTAALAQTSGLATDGQRLYFVDSESSSLRSLGWGDGDGVITHLGQGLFQFGDVDGYAPAARLQHPLGVAVGDGAVWVADTYNHKIKRFDLQSKQVVTFAGTGRPGLTDGPAAQAQFNEPGGLAWAGHRLYVADTNNHCLRVIDTATRQVTTLTLTGLTAPPAAAVTVGAGARLLRLDLPLPAGLHLNPEAPLRVKLHSDAGLVADQTVTLAPGRPREVKVTFRVGHGTLRVAVDAILCDDAGTTCRPSAATAEVALTVAATGADASPELVVRLPLR